MLKEALEDALVRGEKLRRDITKEILNSQVFSDLANNPSFVKAVERVIRSKDEVGSLMQRRMKEMLEAMRIPTRQQVQGFERRVARLERSLNTVSRKMLKKSVQKAATKKGNSKARPGGKRKAAARKSSKS